MFNRRLVIPVVALICLIFIVVYLAPVAQINDLGVPKGTVLFALLDKNNKTENVPSYIPYGEIQSLNIVIDQNEADIRKYTIEVLALNLSIDPKTNYATVNGGEYLDRTEMSVPQNTVVNRQISVLVNSPGYTHIWLSLYNETAPDENMSINERMKLARHYLWLPILNWTSTDSAQITPLNQVSIGLPGQQ